MNRYRVRAGLRSIDPAASESVVVFLGVAVDGDASEAELMEDFARRTLGYTGPSKLDRTSTTTWENIQNAIPFIEAADTIKIVSNSLNALYASSHTPPLSPTIG